ncbi:CotS family spore coat protein [uncultured Clostridium sp.]|jgi:spore coat protein I|uniref:CotS family spore coat protein n=1 Tax=uncultured Clostridium sp. TaxID=59620 RepID=UPI0026380C6C|nr:CotS family spore coat protein [uncultured Clostridium sp.]
MMREFEIERQFDIKIDTLKPSKGIYYLKTNKGDRCLKRINYGTQKLLFVYGAKEHLIQNGFDKIDRYFLNIDEEPYALVNEDLYTLSDWIEGRECDFHNIDEVKLAAQALARLHEASKGYDPPENSKLKTDIGRWPSLMDKRIKALSKMRDMARKKNMKQNFDLTYIKTVDFYKDLAIRASKLLNASEYEAVCEKSEEEKIFCHHDFTYHNIVIDDNNDLHILDFDYCKREIRAFDIANFMIKVLKKVDWDLEFAKAIIESYSSVSAIEEREYKIILAFLLFPQRYWRLANRHYYNEVTWGATTFTKKIQNIINEKILYTEFIEAFKEEYSLSE